MTTRRGRPTATALPTTGRAAKTKSAIRSCQTAVIRLATVTLVLALLPFPHGFRFPFAAVVERQWAPAVARKAAAVVEGGNVTTVVAAVTGSASDGKRVGRLQERQLETETSDGEEVGQGVSRRCWVSQDGRRRCQANVFFFGVSKCGTHFF